MKIFEITAQYNSTLNPKLWSEDGVLDSKVSNKLKQIADGFIDYLENPSLEVSDIIITGSNANFNWTPQSDIDLHILVDVDLVKQSCPDLAEDFFNLKKSNWNNTHNITIYSQPVELYVQNINEPHIAAGVYSLMQDKWLKKPTYNKPSYDDSAVELKAQQLKYEIDCVINDKADKETVEALKAKIRNYRRAGLSSGGEWSIDNLAFKELRNTGYLQKLSDYAVDSVDQDLSL